MAYFNPKTNKKIKIMQYVSDNVSENLWRIEAIEIIDGKQSITVHCVSFKKMFNLFTILPFEGYFELKRVGDISMKPIM